jgi:serine phosphatase RsbU (regulator of sigma subunit)/CHASE3 domain sensor protein
MKRIRALRIGQVIALGFGSILVLASLIGLFGRIAYDITSWQNSIIQTRSDVERLALELEILSIQRTQDMRRYLETPESTLLSSYQLHKAAYYETYALLSKLLDTPEEVQALEGVQRAEAALDQKAKEVLHLHNSNFPAAARFLWDQEGLAAQIALLAAIEDLRQVQGDASTAIINEARWIERLAIIIISVFIPLVLLGGFITSLFVTRRITRPIYNLVKTISTIGSDLRVRVEPSGPRELVFLGETINEMAEQLTSSRHSLEAYKARLEDELALASRIQASFLPTALPQPPGLELAVFWQSAREVGGDFYTCLQMEEGRYGIAVGDVSGKGTPAAMAGALVVGLLEAYAPTHPDPQTLLTTLNNDLYRRLASIQMNVACCYAVLDQSLSCLSVANAGCIYPYLRRGQEVREIPAGGLPLGSLPDFNYTPLSIPLQPGDLLIFSSDGLVEAHNEQGALLGFDRLQQALKNLSPTASAQAALDQLVDFALGFTTADDLNDDMTILVARLVER